MSFMFLRHPAGALAILAIAAGACKQAPKVAMVNGQCADVYHGHVCTWARMQGSTVMAVGLSVPIAAIDSAPAAAGPMVWPPAAAAILQLPESAQGQSGLTHFTMYWEAQGHPPAPFMVPHFDFHFYTIPAAARTAIDCSNLSKPAALPASYALPDLTLPPDMAKMVGVPVLVGLCVPQMGMHSLLASELQSTTPFRGSMVIGYYEGKPVFIEPMISRAMLQEKASFDLPIPAIPGQTGNHPTMFHGEYDAQQGVYQFVFSNFQPAS
jgi:hypothetical protein